MYGDGTQARVESVCAQCGDALGFEFTVTKNGARSDDPAARALREWDPIPTPKDRAEPHMLDGL